MVSNKQVPVSNPRAALKWVLQSENIDTTVPGFTTFDQLETDMSVMEELTLTPEEKKYLELARANPKDSLFCQGCGTCLKQCKIAPVESAENCEGFGALCEISWILDCVLNLIIIILIIIEKELFL